MNQISNLKKLNYASSVFILGSAPTLRFFKHHRNFDGLRIAVGDVPWRAPKFGPFDYWVTSNAFYPLPWNRKHHKHLLKSKSQLLLSSASVNLEKDLESAMVELENVKDDFPITFYDQRHFKYAPCSPEDSCCYFSKLLVTDPSIQEMLSDVIGEPGPAYSEGDSVTLHALALAIILQAKEIFIVGVEMPLVYKDYVYYKDYKIPFENPINFFKRKIKKFHPNYRYKTPAHSHDPIQFFKDFQKIVDIANRLDIKVYSISPTSPINYMVGVNFLDS